MNSRRDFRSHRAALFDGIEEGGIRAPAYSSREIHEQENDQAMDSLHDRVSILKRLTGDIHEEVENLLIRFVHQKKPSQRGHVACNSHPSDRARERSRSSVFQKISRTASNFCEINPQSSTRPPPRPPVPHLRRLVPHRRGEADLALKRRAELSLRRPLLPPPLTARARRAPTGFQRLLALRGRRPGQHPTPAGQEAPTLSSPAPGERQPPSASAPSQRPPPSAAANYCRLQLPGAGSQERATPTPS
ncbi:uncharacterized protein LOC120713124 isoform X1 [Panicum virgatum]|uniref:uncharacterized protein LOC120713124 isoform X1 n=1 Tax=Panicum virgatum TaxID=38727 RepID=UPI0019D5CD48|nr:uncharacterized protein LOC120713124 isoform X1 [Panicum virgatum]